MESPKNPFDHLLMKSDTLNDSKISRRSRQSRKGAYSNLFDRGPTPDKESIGGLLTKSIANSMRTFTKKESIDPRTVKNELK